MPILFGLVELLLCESGEWMSVDDDGVDDVICGTGGGMCPSVIFCVGEL